jgi:hypothetical protein
VEILINGSIETKELFVHKRLGDGIARREIQDLNLKQSRRTGEIWELPSKTDAGRCDCSLQRM